MFARAAFLLKGKLLRWIMSLEIQIGFRRDVIHKQLNGRISHGDTQIYLYPSDYGKVPLYSPAQDRLRVVWCNSLFLSQRRNPTHWSPESSVWCWLFVKAGFTKEKPLQSIDLAWYWLCASKCTTNPITRTLYWHFQYSLPKGTEDTFVVNQQTINFKLWRIFTCKN